MHFKNIVFGLTFGLFALFKVNAEYTGDCYNIYNYLNENGYSANLRGCSTNSEGEVITLNIYPFCLSDEILNIVFSYKTIETLNFNTRRDNQLNCLRLPSLTCENFYSLPNLKTLNLTGMLRLNSNIVANIPRSVTSIILGNAVLTQEVVDELGKLTNLESLELIRTNVPDNSNFKSFKNLKNLVSLSIDYESNDDTDFGSFSSYSHTMIKPNLLKYCRSLKKLVINYGTFNKSSLDALSYMTELEELELNSADFDDDATVRSLKKLTNLISLNINCNGRSLKSFSSGLFYLTNLKYLTLSGLVGTTFSISVANSLTMANLKNLEYFRFTHNGPSLKLKYIDGLPNLKELYLLLNDYTSVPKNIGNLKSLEILDLSLNDITELPSTIYNLENLKELNLSNNEITYLSPEIGNLKNLINLDISDNKITNLPESIGNCTEIESLNVVDNELTSLPSSIGNLTKLSYANFRYNNIVEVPESICNLTELTLLQFCMNNIEKIPDDIGKMKKLTLIDFSYNKITKFPSTVGELENLETFQFSNNLIDDYLPESLNNLTNLKMVHVEDNVDIKGKTLTNKSIINCSYYSKTPYSLCEAENAKCTDYTKSLKKC